MISSSTPLSVLASAIIAKHGTSQWLHWEPETLLFDLEGVRSNEDYPLLSEKIVCLQAIGLGENEILGMPEFLLWFTQVCNNKPAEFSYLYLPTSLELAWSLEQARLSFLRLEKSWEPSEALKHAVGYLLKEDGYSKPISPFNFVPEALLAPGQTEADTQLKEKAIQAYFQHMRLLAETDPSVASNFISNSNSTL